MCGMNLNKAQLIGRVTNDPETKALPSGMSVSKFGLATNHVYKTKEGEKKETTQFHNCIAFGKRSDIISQWLKKGQEVYVDGRIEYRSWDKKEGGKGYITEIIIENFQMGAKARGSNSGGQESTSERREESESNKEVPVVEIDKEDNEDNEDNEEDDLPF
ncbi:single-stranded DNA-binding protein [Patescibacteria group bacterium]|nr:single-stranded DNA-binding protein [Patescibacteria group bacterium]